MLTEVGISLVCGSSTSLPNAFFFTGFNSNLNTLRRPSETL
jgi:hypothetical protein